MHINIRKLHNELYYHPPWPKDKATFIKFMHQTYFTKSDIILFTRLYIQYSHLHYSQKNELSKYFKYVLEKMQIKTSQELFKITKEIYQNRIDTIKL